MTVDMKETNLCDQWITPANSRNSFTIEALEFAADVWTPFIEKYHIESRSSHSAIIEIAREQKKSCDGKSELSATLHHRDRILSLNYYILLLTLNVKNTVASRRTAMVLRESVCQEDYVWGDECPSVNYEG